MQPSQNLQAQDNGRRSKGQIFGVPGEAAILRALMSKNNAMRRLETVGRRNKMAGARRSSRVA